MSIKIKLRTVVNAVEPLKGVIELEIPIKIAYRLARMSRKINSELTSYEEARLKLIKQYGKEEKGKPGSFKVNAENTDKYFEELNKLLDVEVEIDADTVKLDTLGDVKIKTKDLINLENFIVE